MLTLPSFQSAFARSHLTTPIINQGLKPSGLSNPSTDIYQNEETSWPLEEAFPPTPPATPPTPTTSNNFECEFCHKSYGSRSKLMEHQKYRHSEARPHRCSQCSKVFKSNSNLKQHVKCAHERPRVACQECPPELRSKLFSESGLRYHKLTTHWENSSREMHCCQICAKSFVQATLLRKHMASAHAGERKFTCPYCPATFKRKDHADRHVTDTHSLVGELFECEVCHGRFQSASRLKQHAKLHHDQNLRKPCHLCGKTMLAKNLMTHYLRAHS